MRCISGHHIATFNTRGAFDAKHALLSCFGHWPPRTTFHWRLESWNCSASLVFIRFVSSSFLELKSGKYCSWVQIYSYFIFLSLMPETHAQILINLRAQLNIYLNVAWLNAEILSKLKCMSPVIWSKKKYHKINLFLKMTLNGNLLLWEVLLRVSSVCLKRIQHSSLKFLKKTKKLDEKI